MNFDKLDKIRNKIKKDLEELDGMDETALRKVVADSEETVATATKQRDENEKYKKAKQAVKDLSGGLRDLKSFQNARKQYALHRLRELRGDVPAAE